MTDPRTPLTDDDLSAFLDGEADDALAARIQADGDAQARLVQLRRASEALAATVVAPLEPAVVDGLIATALAAATSGAAAETAGSPAGPEATVHPLAPPASRRRSTPTWLVAAGLVVLVGIGLALVWSGTHSNDATTTDVAATATESSKAPDSKSAADSAADGDAGSASAATPDGAGAGGHASPTTVAPAAGTADQVPVIALGTFATPDALREELATAFPSEGSAESGTDRAITSTSIDRCAGLLQQILPVTGAPTHIGEAEVAGKTVVVYEFAASDDAGDDQPTTTGPVATTLTVAVHPEACDQVLAFQR